jgi:hypothetical protein
MKNLLKKSAKYVFSIVPLAAIVMVVNFGKPLNATLSATGNAPGTYNVFSDDLPCGYTQKGPLVTPQKPTFVTNNYVPILQFPAGIFPGTNVTIGNAIYSQGETDQLILQEDGNLVLYCTTCNPLKPLWASQTRGKDAKTLFFQTDGDLVLRNSFGRTVWHSNIHSTCAGSEQAYFTLQDDGNLVMLYNQNPDATGSTYLLGSTGCTNDQSKMSHPGKIQ